jgi:hypothetical protein
VPIVLFNKETIVILNSSIAIFQKSFEKSIILFERIENSSIIISSGRFLELEYFQTSIIIIFLNFSNFTSPCIICLAKLSIKKVFPEPQGASIIVNGDLIDISSGIKIMFS